MNFVNENALLSKISFFLKNSERVIFELLQNSQRAEAKNVKIETDFSRRNLRFTDDGIGLKDPKPLFILAETAWKEEVINSQTPAGWGMFFLYSISDEVTFRSHFGEIKIECSKFLSNSSYRDGIFEGINKESTFNGFEVIATLKSEEAQFLDIAPDLSVDNESDGLRLKQLYFCCSLYRLNISINNISVKQMIVDTENFKIVKDLGGGNILLLNNFESWSVDATNALEVIWYGQYISMDRYLSSHTFRFLHSKEIEKGQLHLSKFFRDVIIIESLQEIQQPVTPILPYRESIKEDAHFEKLRKEIQNYKVNYAINKVNELVKHVNDDNNRYLLILYLDFICSQNVLEEILNKLNCFIARRSNYFEHKLGYSYRDRDVVIIKKGEKITLPKISLKTRSIDSEEELEVSDFLLNFYSDFEIYSWEISKNVPEWVQIEEKKYEVVVEYDIASLLMLESNWMPIKVISTNLPDIHSIIIPEYESWCEKYRNGDRVILYTEGADLEELVCNRIFNLFFFNEEGEESEIQWDNFYEMMNSEISQIINKYDIARLLEGLLVIPEINYTNLRDISSVSICREKNTIMIEFSSGNKIVKPVKRDEGETEDNEKEDIVENAEVDDTADRNTTSLYYIVNENGVITLSSSSFNDKNEKTLSIVNNGSESEDIEIFVSNNRHISECGIAVVQVNKQRKTIERIAFFNESEVGLAEAKFQEFASEIFSNWDEYTVSDIADVLESGFEENNQNALNIHWFN